MLCQTILIQASQESDHEKKGIDKRVFVLKHKHWRESTTSMGLSTHVFRAWEELTDKSISHPRANWFPNTTQARNTDRVEWQLQEPKKLGLIQHRLLPQELQARRGVRLDSFNTFFFTPPHFCGWDSWESKFCHLHGISPLGGWRRTQGCQPLNVDEC